MHWFDKDEPKQPANSTVIGTKMCTHPPLKTVTFTTYIHLILPPEDNFKWVRSLACLNGVIHG